MGSAFRAEAPHFLLVSGCCLFRRIEYGIKVFGKPTMAHAGAMFSMLEPCFSWASQLQSYWYLRVMLSMAL